LSDDNDDFLEQLVEWIWQGEPKYSEKTCPGATLSTTKSLMTTRSRTPDRSGGKPATNRLSYGAAYENGFKIFWTKNRKKILFQLWKSTRSLWTVMEIGRRRCYIRSRVDWCKRLSGGRNKVENVRQHQNRMKTSERGDLWCEMVDVWLSE
jgi:hypothetical protein